MTLPFQSKISTVQAKNKVSKTPEPTRQPTNLINSGIVTRIDQFVLLNTKGLLVKKAKITEATQEIALDRDAGNAQKFNKG